MLTFDAGGTWLKRRSLATRTCASPLAQPLGNNATPRLPSQKKFSFIIA